MNNKTKNNLADEYLDKLCKEHGIFVSPIQRRIFREMYKAGFSAGLYEAQDSIDALLNKLNN